MVDGAADTGHIAGDGRGDPVPVLGSALALRTQDQASAVGGELAVTTDGIAAGEVPEEEEIGCRRGQLDTRGFPAIHGRRHPPPRQGGVSQAYEVISGSALNTWSCQRRREASSG